MCIALLIPKGEKITRETLEQCFQSNPHGAGFMLSDNNKLIIRKGYFTFAGFWASWIQAHKKYPDTDYVAHFRIATSGELDRQNCHPHKISEQLAYVHNGILDIDVPQKSKISDSQLIGYTKARSEGFTAEKNDNLVAKPPKRMKNNGFLEPR